MTATDELRRLLDERGVKWDDRGYPKTVTVWESDGIEWFGLWRDGAIELEATMTPEQAVEATLGRGTCRVEERYGDWYCTGCGEMVGTYDTASELHIDGNAIELWRYCPNCGRKVNA